MKKLYIAITLTWLMICPILKADIWDEVQKNEAIEVFFPMLDSTNWAVKKTGLSPADNAFYKDGAGAWTALAISDTAAEISGSTGTYEISLSAAEMNHDYITITFTASGASQQTVQFKTYTNDVDSLSASVWAYATRILTAFDEDDTTIDLNGTTVGGLTTWDKTGYSISGTITTLDGLNTQLSTTHGAASWATATGFSTHSAADVWAVGTRTLTAIDEDSTTLDLNATLIGGIAGTIGTFDALDTALDSAHGANSWATATGFSTHSAADVWAVATRQLSGTINDFDELNNTFDSAHGAGSWEDAGGSIPSVTDIWAGLNAAQLAKFMTVDTGESTAVAGSVAKISQGAAGGNVTVGSFDPDALDQLVQEDTGNTTSVSGSVTWLAGKCGFVNHTYIVTSSVDSSPIPNVIVWATSDITGHVIVDVEKSDINGQVTLQVPAGTIYIWAVGSGYGPSGPDEETAE